MFKYGVFFGTYFPVFGLNTGIYGPEKTPYLNTFHAVISIQDTLISPLKQCNVDGRLRLIGRDTKCSHAKFNFRLSSLIRSFIVTIRITGMCFSPFYHLFFSILHR